MPFIEPKPEVISPNPGGELDPLGESVLLSAQAAMRVFEPEDLRLVVGRHQDPERELLVDQARADGIPMHRRLTGGGAVILAPGMLVVALRLPREGGVDAIFARVNAALITAIDPLIRDAHCVERGHGDLAISENDECPARKICGASLRQTRDCACYLGVLLIDDAVPLMERYLAPPSRRPDYRGERDHRAFCTHLGAYGGRLDLVRESVAIACQPLLAI